MITEIAPLSSIVTVAATENQTAMVLGIGLFATVGLCVFVGVVGETIRKVAQTNARERSRREIAAYIAEGSMSPDDGIRLMAAGESLKDKLGVKF